MPRRARSFGSSGYMHVITRGIGRQLLFEEDNDYSYYLKLLEKCSIETGVKICAYCLMENHVHLLVFDDKHNIAAMMKKLGVRYSWYFNNKYDRTGHLFQDRFKSENIEALNYLMVSFRYILQNPQKAGICRASEYVWSSYDLYESKTSFVDTSMLSKLIGSRGNYESFINANNNDECMEYDKTIHTDDWAIAVIKDVLKVESGTVLQGYSKEKRDNAIKTLRRRGITIKQIERLTGINRGVIQRAKP